MNRFLFIEHLPIFDTIENWNPSHIRRIHQSHAQSRKAQQVREKFYEVTLWFYDQDDGKLFLSLELNKLPMSFLKKVRTVSAGYIHSGG